MEYTGIDKAPKESLDSKPYLESSKFINSLIGSYRYSLSHLLLQKASRHGQDHERVVDDARRSGGGQLNKRGGNTVEIHKANRWFMLLSIYVTIKR
jgi:hypothetical protein